MIYPFFSRIVACASGAALLAAPAQAQALSDREGYDSLLSCAALFSAAAAATEGEAKTSDEATELATAFMTGAMLLAPGGNSKQAEAELAEQAQLFAVAMLDEGSAMAKDLEAMADNCGTLGETYLPEVIARGG